MNICVITDNEYLYKEFKKLIQVYDKKYKFDFFYSAFNKKMNQIMKQNFEYRPIDLQKEDHKFWDNYELFLSLHCKQIFPDELVKNYRCINIHPGFNPYNRGWYPQAFSIINHKPVGVTIHEMDTQLDHGSIIVQEEVPIYEYETSYDVYKKIQNVELKLLKTNLLKILERDYAIQRPKIEGNINYRVDFDKLCELDLDKIGTYRQFIEQLRATTFPPYDNAFFYDISGEKIYISINIKRTNNQIKEELD